MLRQVFGENTFKVPEELSLLLSDMYPFRPQCTFNHFH